MRGAKALYLFLTFYFQRQISDLALMLPAATFQNARLFHMLYQLLLAPVFAFVYILLRPLSPIVCSGNS